MTSGDNNFNYFAENQRTKFSARDAGDFSDAQFSRIFFQDFPGPGILMKKIPGLSRRRWNPEQITALLIQTVKFIILVHAVTGRQKWH